MSTNNSELNTKLDNFMGEWMFMLSDESKEAAKTGLKQLLAQERAKAEKSMLEKIKHIAFPDSLADRGGIYALQTVNNELKKLEEQ